MFHHFGWKLPIRGQLFRVLAVNRGQFFSFYNRESVTIVVYCYALSWPIVCELYFYVFTTVHDDQSAVVSAPSFL